MIKVTDLNGLEIEVDDLDEAINKTAEYKEFEHENEGFSEMDKKLKSYWKDMHEKLLRIKSDEI